MTDKRLEEKLLACSSLQGEEKSNCLINNTIDWAKETGLLKPGSSADHPGFGIFKFGLKGNGLSYRERSRFYAKIGEKRIDALNKYIKELCKKHDFSPVPKLEIMGIRDGFFHSPRGEANTTEIPNKIMVNPLSFFDDDMTKNRRLVKHEFGHMLYWRDVITPEVLDKFSGRLSQEKIEHYGREGEEFAREFEVSDE